MARVPVAEAVEHDKASGHPVTVTGDILCRAESVEALLTGLMAP